MRREERTIPIALAVLNLILSIGIGLYADTKALSAS